MRVLYLNHTSLIGGAEHSLLTLINALPAGIEPIVACPSGPLQKRVEALGVQVELVHGTSGSFRLGPLRTARAVADVGRSAAATRAISRRLCVELVHANSVRAGLIAAVARGMGGPPVVIHVRDVLPRGLAGNLVRRTIRFAGRQSVCISEHVAASLGTGRGVRVIHNGVSLERFHPSAVDRPRQRRMLGIEPDDSAIGVVAQITPWKGQADAIAALALLKRERPRARLLLIGEPKFVSSDTRFDNESYIAELWEATQRLEVSDRVTFLGERDDIPASLCALDVVLVPSWEEPFGRTVIEAMAMERAVVATCVGGPAEIIDHGVTGLLSAPRDPVALSRQIERLLVDDELRSAMGRAARGSLAGRFDAGTHVRQMIELYRAALTS